MRKKFSTNPQSTQCRHDSHMPLLPNRLKERRTVYIEKERDWEGKTLGSFAMLLFGMKCMFGLWIVNPSASAGKINDADKMHLMILWEKVTQFSSNTGDQVFILQYNNLKNNCKSDFLWSLVLAHHLEGEQNDQM